MSTIEAAAQELGAIVRQYEPGIPGRNNTAIDGRKDKKMSWQNRQFDERGQEFISYPYIQWVNDGNSLDPRQKHGGFACPTDQGITIPGKEMRIVHSGGSTEVIATSTLTVAVLYSRFCWVQDGMRQQSYVPGARGKTQAVCYLKDAPDAGIVMLTLTGMVGKRFQEARNEATGQVRRATKGKAPSYAFWVTLKAGEAEMVGKGTQKSPITPIVLAQPVNVETDYIGDELVDAIPWAEIKEWAAAWKKGGEEPDELDAGDGNNAAASPPFDDFGEAPPEPWDDLPF
jgi:hypothetical protein